eukprot:GFUD01000296.1.p1 GENE.GFUD01000296.1~~GFUD01000296.1.p1  ORF type:complete len:452 (-),score=130.40 GFUD01000296.1:42-1397(-)
MANDKHKVKRVSQPVESQCSATSPHSFPFVPTDILSQLPSCVVWQLLSYLDTDSIVSLAGVNTTLRQLVIARFNLTMTLPITPSFANYLKQNPYSHNKSVLRLRISHLTPDYIKQDKMDHSSHVQQLPISKQLLLINLSSLTTLCLHLEQTDNVDISSYRLAFLALLQSTGVFKQLTKLHLTTFKSFLLNLLPENFGSNFMKDALSVDKLVITLSGEQSTKEKEENTEDYRKGLENFVSMVKARKFVLNIGNEPSNKKIVKILSNDYIQCFELVAPCNFQPKLKMSRVRELNMSTTGQNCPVQPASHQLGKCVLDWRMVRDGCPRLKVFGGVNVKEFKEMRVKKKKEQEFMKKVRARTVRVGKHKRRLRCGECEGCKKSNCGKCRNCKDMKMFGGKGTGRQACEGRKCQGMAGGKVEVKKQSQDTAREGLAKDIPKVPVVNWTKFILCSIK